jgi:FdhD protein
MMTMIMNNSSVENGVTREVGIRLLNGRAKTIEDKRDQVAVEEPLHILVNGERYASIICSPSDRQALVVGDMAAEGIIRSLDEIVGIRTEEGGAYAVTLSGDVDISKRIDITSSFKRLILSSCGGSPSDWPFTKIIDRINMPSVGNDRTLYRPETISACVRELNSLAKTFRKTGGVHGAALYTWEGSLLSFAEDVGRHNAVDKVIGLALQQGKGFVGTFIASTGRLTGDIVLKAARMRIPLVASLATAISSGIDVAARTGVTLIGFVRGERMTIYTYPDRVSW